jgi:hypothetical protein
VSVSPSTTRRGRARLARAGLLTLVLVAAATLGVLASACGGSSSSEGVANVDSTQTTTTDSGSADGSSSADPAAFSACMRRNGLPEFPDPDSDGRIRFRGPIDPESSQFKAARQACRELEPEESAPSPAEQAQDRAQLLEFAACMRANGLPKFPDPNPDGGLRIGRNSGVDPNSPQFKAAEKACETLLPGGSAPTGDPVPQP